jgi:endonuclease/exonuclease/phosphatase family metal-dependent hydrolase
MMDIIKLVVRSAPIILSAIILSASVIARYNHSNGSRQENTPEVFTYPELVTLYKDECLSGPLERKLTRLLTTPFVENLYAGAEPPRLSQNSPLGEFLRVAFWNIERGLKYEEIEAALSDGRRFTAMLDSKKFPPDSFARSQALEQAAQLRSADVIVLNEVDWGVSRTGYRHVAGTLAKKLKMNFAYGVQFVELSPVALSLKPHDADDESGSTQRTEFDVARYKGLHGVAILSRFPLDNARLAPFDHQPYDWYKSEKEGATQIERGKRQISHYVFSEETAREVRRGGRTMLFADIVDKRLPSGRVTIVTTQLENRTTPGNRARQLKQLLARIQGLSHPVILAGDMNTSTEDATPTSVQREFTKRIKSKSFWLQRGVGYATGLGFIVGFTFSGVKYVRTQGDPTVRNIPLIASNPEGRFFSELKNFRFTDGGAFDFRGDSGRSSGENGGTLANSNERANKGFVTTYRFDRPIKSVGKYKLDWILVKPATLTNPTDRRQSYRFAPHFGRTLRILNKGIEDQISDHCPLLVDLPLGEPPLGKRGKSIIYAER